MVFAVPRQIHRDQKTSADLAGLRKNQSALDNISIIDQI